MTDTLSGSLISAFGIEPIMATEDPYSVLGVTRSSDPIVVEAAYRALVKEHHPDQGGTRGEFRRIKAAYDEIKRRQSREENDSTGVAVSCVQCGENFSTHPRYFEKFGHEPVCNDCLVHTECSNCGTGLRLSHSRFSELGGNPVVCTDCSASESQGTWFWHGLTIGEKIVFPIAAGLLAFNVLLAVNGASDSFLALPALVFTGWIYRRGRRNVNE
jgi:hypothetical protein